MTKLENCPSVAQCIFVALLLVFAQVQARDHAWTDRESRSDAHETGPESVLKHSSWRHPWRNPSIAGEFQRQVAAAGSRRNDAESNAAVFHRTHQGKTYGAAPHQRDAVKSTRRSRQEMRALMNFRAGISKADISTFRNWDTNDSTPCAWTGVSCSRSHRKPHVTELKLPSHQLVGSINSALFALSKLDFLEKLDLSDNNFTSFISGAALVNFSSLSHLNLSYNQVSGEIPERVGELSNLQSLVLTENDLSGQIPPSISNCTMLRVLDLKSNLLVSHIPEAFGRLTHLEELFLGTSAPAMLSAAPVQKNKILGPIPSSLGNCSSLSTFSLTISPDLGGEIPSTFSQLRNLQSLTLFDCGLQGALPPWMGNLTHLTEIILVGNRLHGTIPADFGRLHNLSTLALEENVLTGSIPSDLGNCTSLIRLDLQHNSLQGVLPNFTSLKSLQVLDVSSNNFSGELPQSLASLPDLVFFNASFNSFVGPIPQTGAFKSNLTATSFLGNPGLCGAILGPSRACQKNASESRSSGDCEGFRCPEKLVPTSIGGVTFIIFVAAVVMGWRVRTKAEKEMKKKEEAFEVVVNFSPNLPKFAAKEILALIKAGGNVVGTSSWKSIYRGLVPGYGVIIIEASAIHESEGTDPGEFDSWKSFIEREATTQASLHHPNILKVLRFYSNLQFRAVLLEHMPQGSLESHLYPNVSVHQGGEILDQSCQLPWSVRFGIAVDVAKGMTHIHHDLQESLVHGDLKPSNIFLDQDMVAKVADLGISKLVNLHPGEETVSNIHGTVGYMPPEYAFVTTISTRGDVFSYGVLLLEMLSGMSPTNVPFDRDYRVWNLQHFHASPTQMLDPILQQEGRMAALKSKQMLLLAKIAFFCTRGNPQSRPSMKDVLSMLIQVQEVGVDKIPKKTANQPLRAEDHQGEANHGVSAWENDDLNGVNLPFIPN